MQVLESTATLLVCGDVSAPSEWAGPVCRLAALPEKAGIESLDTPWVVWRVPGEDGEENDRVLARVAEQLNGVGPETAALEVLRREDSATGVREMFVVRACRTGAFRGMDDDAELAVAGLRLRTHSLQLQLTRSGSDLVSRAESAERSGRWLAAHQHWLLLREQEGAWGAYGALRAGLALGFLQPRSGRIRDLLGEAWVREPGLVEAGLRLAAWWLDQGDLRRAVVVAAQADASRAHLARIPQVEGAGSWATAAMMARALASRRPDLAETYARQALEQELPAPLRSELLALVARPQASARG